MKLEILFDPENQRPFLIVETGEDDPFIVRRSRKDCKVHYQDLKTGKEVEVDDVQASFLSVILSWGAYRSIYSKRVGISKYLKEP